MSKHDQHFVTTFMIVIGSLVLFMVLILILSGFLHAKTEARWIGQDPRALEKIESQIAPLGVVTISGEPAPRRAAIASSKDTIATPAVNSGPRSGETVYKLACVACHGAGIAGAPRFDDKNAWSSRITK